MSQLLPTIRSRLQALRFYPLRDEVLAATGAEPWMVAAARGSFHRLEQWQAPVASALKTQAVSALSSLTEKNGQISSFLESIKDRETADLGSAFFQQFLRDAYLRKLNITDIVHADCDKALNAWSRFSATQILEVWRQAHQLASDLTANLDRVLSYEIFFQRGRRILSPAVS
jgi:hypothetical protein